MAKAKWETFSEEELKEIYFNSKTCVEFFRNMGYKMKPDSRAFDKIKDKYPWIQNYGSYNKHLEGQRFGRLTVISATEERDVCGRIKWLCECNCKNKTKVKVSTSELHKNSSCGCIRREKASQRLSENFHDLTGMRFGFLEVISKSEIKSPHGVLWNCYCHNCNTLVQHPILGVNLKKKNGTKSCGCLKESFCETNLAKLFEKENIDYEKQYSFNDLIGEHSVLRFDYVVFDNNEIKCLIECQGEQHYNPIDHFGGEKQFLRQQSYDNKKREYCKQHNLKLIEIPYWDFDKIDSEYLLNLIK